jgi:hypothetical protein
MTAKDYPSAVADFLIVADILIVKVSDANMSNANVSTLDLSKMQRIVEGIPPPAPTPAQPENELLLRRAKHGCV